jgi:hypothetical protein
MHVAPAAADMGMAPAAMTAAVTAAVTATLRWGWSRGEQQSCR